MDIVVACNDENILKGNLLKSDIKGHDLIIMRGYDNVSKAYNDALLKVKSSVVMFVHQDVIIPRGWFERLYRSINLTELGEKGGVVGVAGANYENGLAYKGNIVNDGKEWKHGRTGSGGEYDRVQTVEELLFVTNNKVVFDERLGNHFYCADLCLRFLRNGHYNYVINNPVYHSGGVNNKKVNGEFVYSESFYKSKKIMEDKYQFPIATTCTLINA